MKTKKTTIAILVTLAFGIAAAQAGRGCILTVPDKDDCQSQTQHASHAVHTFDISLETNETYEIEGYTYNLTTMDASSPGTLVEIVVIQGGVSHSIADIQIPNKKETMENLTVKLEPTLSITNITGDELTLTVQFNFVHSASAFGFISLNGCVVPCPTASGDLETTSYANADDKPHLKWNAKISVRGNDSSPGVGNETISSQRQAPNAGKTKTNNGKGKGNNK